MADNLTTWAMAAFGSGIAAILVSYYVGDDETRTKLNFIATVVVTGLVVTASILAHRSP